MTALTKDPIDILKLYSNSNFREWNKFLWVCAKTEDVNKLTDVAYRLQLGMDKLAKQKLNTEKICVFFIRLQRSIENTIRQIHRDKFQNPLYDPKNKHLYEKHIADKRKKQHELELFLRKNRY